jgi:hypothetical protein
MNDGDIGAAIRAAKERRDAQVQAMAVAVAACDEVAEQTADAIYRDVKKMNTRARNAARDLRELIALLEG